MGSAVKNTVVSLVDCVCSKSQQSSKQQDQKPSQSSQAPTLPSASTSYSSLFPSTFRQMYCSHTTDFSRLSEETSAEAYTDLGFWPMILPEQGARTTTLHFESILEPEDLPIYMTRGYNTQKSTFSNKLFF